MIADSEISRELQSLRQELPASPPEHPSSPADPVSPRGGAAPQTSQPEDPAGGQQPQGTAGKFIEAITEFFEASEKNVLAHPAAHVIGGIVVGILIGRLVGRR